MESQQGAVSSRPKSSAPQAVREWLQSETVTDLVVELNASHFVVGSSIKKLPDLITRVAIGALPPEKFTSTLAESLPFLEPDQVVKIASQVRDRILKPLAGALKSSVGIDVSKINTTIAGPTARTMTIEGSISRAVPTAAAPTVQKTSVQQAVETERLRARTMTAEGSITEAQRLAKSTTTKAAPQPGAALPQQPRARTMEIQGSFSPLDRTQKIEIKKVVDIKKPAGQAQAGPTAQITNIQGSLTPLTPAAGKEASSVKAPVAPAIRRPEKAADLLETTAPIGLSEVVPQAPTPSPAAQTPALVPDKSVAPHELAPYHDEHPMVE